MLSIILDWIKTIVIAIVIYLFISHFLSFSVIDGTSMEGTFYDADHAIMFHSREYDVDDVIGFEFDDEIKGPEYHIKRIVAVPGDDVLVTANQVYVNNQLIIEDGMQFYPEEEYQLAEDEYFVIGDNYEVSYDSRAHGPIKKDDIVGKVILHLGKYQGDGTHYLTTDSSRKPL